MLTFSAQVPCNSRSLRNRTDSMPFACVRFEQQDFPSEEEEWLDDTHSGIPVDRAWQGERRMSPRVELKV